MMRCLSLLLLSTIGLFVVPSAVNAMTAKEGWEHAETVIERIQAPTFPNADFDMSEYGAIGDGSTDCTDAFKRAVEACHAAGGGRVVVPPDGTYLTGPIVLLSNVNLHIHESSTIRFTQDTSAYLPLVRTRWEGVELMNYSPLIYAYRQDNIGLTGGGTLDGNANETVWWDWKSGPQDDGRALLFQMAADNVPVHQRLFGDGHYLRPNFIEPYWCRNVLIEGVKVISSPMWVIHPTFCSNVIVRGVTVDSHGPNNDGCDPDSCQDVLIENSSFDTGDDCVAVKSGRGDDGRRVDIPSVDVIMRNCTMKDGHGGLVAGSEIAAGVRNLYAEDCRWDSPNLRYGLRIKFNPLFGGVAENIFVRNVRMKQVGRAAIRINSKYEMVEEGPHMPRVSNIFVQNVTSERSSYALQLEALNNARAKNITIANSTFLNVERRNVIEFVDNLVLEDVAFEYDPYQPGPGAFVLGYIGVLIVACVLGHNMHRPVIVKTPCGTLNLSRPISWYEMVGSKGSRLRSGDFGKHDMPKGSGCSEVEKESFFKP